MEVQFPAGLRVLVVDDDPICLLIVERLLRSCLYQVTTCEQAVMALAMLRENKSRFDVVLSDVHMPHMDGFKLLELVRLEMDVPVIMMSTNGDTSSVMKGISQGACDYLLKPVRLEELQNIWQHVVRKQHTPAKVSKLGHDVNDRERARTNETEPEMTVGVAQDGATSCTTQRKRKGFLDEDSANEDEDNSCTAKRQRVVWSVELHQKFVCAINHLGLEQAVPKRILDLMNVPNLTRENVASHLQKYRLYLKKMSGPGMSTCIRPSDSFLNSPNFWNEIPAVQLDGFSRQTQLPLPAGVGDSPMTTDSIVKYINQRGFVNNIKDPDMQAHLGMKDSIIETRSGTAWGLKSVLKNSSQCFLPQGLRVPVPVSILQNARQGASEFESFGRDHLFIHQLEMAGVTQISQSDLCSSFDEKRIEYLL